MAKNMVHLRSSTMLHVLDPKIPIDLCHGENSKHGKNAKNHPTRGIPNWCLDIEFIFFPSSLLSHTTGLNIRTGQFWTHQSSHVNHPRGKRDTKKSRWSHCYAPGSHQDRVIFRMVKSRWNQKVEASLYGHRITINYVLTVITYYYMLDTYSK